MAHRSRRTARPTGDVRPIGVINSLPVAEHDERGRIVGLRFTIACAGRTSDEHLLGAADIVRFLRGRRVPLNSLIGSDVEVIVTPGAIFALCLAGEDQNGSAGRPLSSTSQRHERQSA
jgi:hypothetical protein